MVVRSYPVSHARPGPPASESGRAIISIWKSATVLSSGTTGCSMYQRVPTRPASSPVLSRTTMVRFGAGPPASSRAISRTATVPLPSSSAPL